MARQFQLRGDTEEHWLEADPVLAERELVLVATDRHCPHSYDQCKVGDGVHRFSELKYRGLPAVQERGSSLTEVMSQFAVTRELEGVEGKLEGTGKALEGVTEDVKELEKVLVLIDQEKGEWHWPNTDTGTNSRSFYIHRVLLENCHSGLELRNADDTGYEDLTVKDLFVKGRLFADKGVVETETEEVRTKNNWIVLNDGEIGEGVSSGKAGIMIDRGSVRPFVLVYEEEAGALKGGFEGELGRVALTAELLESGASVVWDEEAGRFVPGIDVRCMRKDRIFVMDALPSEEEGVEEGDIFIVPTEEEEMGDEGDFAEEFLRAIVKPVCRISVCSYRKEGDREWVEGTVVIRGSSEAETASDVVVLYRVSGEDWRELVIRKGTKCGEIAVERELCGRVLEVRLKEYVGDDVYIYTVDERVEVAN